MHGKAAIWPNELPALMTPTAMTSDSEFAPFTESESEDSLSSEEDSSFSDMRFMRADCDKALCVDPCFKEYHTLKYY